MARPSSRPNDFLRFQTEQKAETGLGNGPSGRAESGCTVALRRESKKYLGPTTLAGTALSFKKLVFTRAMAVPRPCQRGTYGDKYRSHPCVSSFPRRSRVSVTTSKMYIGLTPPVAQVQWKKTNPHWRGPDTSRAFDHKPVVLWCFTCAVPQRKNGRGCRRAFIPHGSTPRR
jgi:hypothetical protein